MYECLCSTLQNPAIILSNYLLQVESWTLLLFLKEKGLRENTNVYHTNLVYGGDCLVLHATYFGCQWSIFTTSTKYVGTCMSFRYF